MAAINKTMPKIEISGPTGACSYPLLKELFQPSYQPNHQNKHAGNVNTQVLVIARRPVQKFRDKEWIKAKGRRGADLRLLLSPALSSSPESVRGAGGEGEDFPDTLSRVESRRAGALRSGRSIASRKF